MILCLKTCNCFCIKLQLVTIAYQLELKILYFLENHLMWQNFFNRTKEESLRMNSFCHLISWSIVDMVKWFWYGVWNLYSSLYLYLLIVWSLHAMTLSGVGICALLLSVCNGMWVIGISLRVEGGCDGIK